LSRKEPRAKASSSSASGLTFDLDSALRRKREQRRKYTRLSIAEKMHIMDELHDNMIWMMNKVRPIVDGEVFYYTHLLPERTGLRQVIWVPDPLAKDRHMRVQVRHGRGARPNNVVLVSIKRPRILRLSERDAEKLRRFIGLNREALLAHAAGEIDSFQLHLRTKKLPDPA
jgi:hypothetical protein